MNISIKNGVPMYDVDGNRMHVQFPHIIYHKDKYYLYGTNKEFSDGKSGIWHWGVRMYESDDLYNWKSVGIIIPPEENVPDSPLNPRATMDAPCIIYNSKTDQWVCWIINMDQKMAFTLVSDSLVGPYRRTGDGFFPCGFTIGDYDLAQTEEGKGYIYFNHPHTEIVCAELTADFTSVTGEYNIILKHPEGVPFAREAPSHFFRDGKNYLITSGTTSFFPNPSEIAVGERHLGDYRTLGNPHVGDESQTSFHTQIRSVFKHPKKKNLYIALADRWLPDYMHLPYEIVKNWYYVRFHDNTPENLELVKKQGEEYNVIQSCAKQDITRAQCVFLPISFDEETPKIYWRDEWRIEEFE